MLETLYAAFDAIAKRRRIFKVETIGDCYVAVSGLPEPRADHALIMSKFANDIMNAMRTISRDLEISLGPDTGDLALRIGIHSGPVTAGVLRGERARFQLFGDTMNTAARMEQTGIKNRIQVSQATADCLVAEGKRYGCRCPSQFPFYDCSRIVMFLSWLSLVIGYVYVMTKLLQKEKVK